MIFEHPELPPWQLRTRALPLTGRRYLMGVVNVTPDSFSDGGAFFDGEATAHERAVAHALSLLDAGADILDVGGESTRPGAPPVPAHEEIARVLPVVEGVLAARPDAIISVDTTKAAVAEATLRAGAEIINDISGLGFDAALPGVVAARGAGLVIMHIRGTPETMQRRENLLDDTGALLDEVDAFLAARVVRATDAGVSKAHILLDPGIGFGKTPAQNYALIRHMDRLTATGHGVLLGPSRKSFLTAAVGPKPPHERVWATAGAIACGVLCGAHVLRVHDVAELRDVVRVAEAVLGM